MAIQNQKLPFHKLQSPEPSPQSSRPSDNLHRHLNKTFKSRNFIQVESSILQMALYNPPIHLLAVLWKVLFFGWVFWWRRRPSIQTGSLTATSSASLSWPLTAAWPTRQHTRLIKHVLFFSPASFYLHGHAWHSVHFDQFFGYSHMVSLGQPDLIKDSQTVYMHQITPHALCSAASSVALQPPPSLLLFALYLLPSPFFFPRPHDFKPLWFLCPPTLSLQSLIENAALSSRLLPSSFSLHVFRFTQSRFQWPHPSNFPPIFPCSCSSRWKVGVVILLHHEKLPAQSGTTLWARSAILFSLFHSCCWPHSQILNLCLISFLFPRQWVHTLQLYCCLTIVFSFVCPHLLTGSIYWS